MVTLRMVASTIASTCGPLSSRNWTGSLCENFAHWLELARTNPAITIETKTCNTPRPTLADTARSPLTASLSCGAKVCNAAVRLVKPSSRGRSVFCRLRARFRRSLAAEESLGFHPECGLRDLENARRMVTREQLRQHLDLTLGYIGTQPSSYPINSAEPVRALPSADETP
jgi:hypothetical protein